jgi:hypothetical protein
MPIRLDAALPELSAILLTALLLSGCAGGTNFSILDARLASGDCPAAIALIEAHGDADGGSQQLLYFLDAAMVHMQCGNLDQAQAHFRSAEDLAERLWTESISRGTFSLVTNDRVLAYTGEDFERVMIHLMSAIGFLKAGRLDEALVEARRLESLLAVYNDKYEKKNVYKEDAFARYLSGILRDADRDPDGAFIDYLKAARTYRRDIENYGAGLPETLAADLVRMAAAVDRLEDVEGLLPRDAMDRYLGTAPDPDHGKVVVIAFSGYAPQKVQDMLVVPTPHGPIGVAFPKMAAGPPGCTRGRLALAGDEIVFESDLDLVQDIGRIAVNNLKDRRGRILAKAIVRAAAKQAAIHGIANTREDRDDQRTVEAVLNLVNILLVERADTRSWRTLPGQILMTRVYVPAGEYAAKLTACENMTLDLGRLTVAAGDTRFLIRDLRYPEPIAGETIQ